MGDDHNRPRPAHRILVGVGGDQIAALDVALVDVDDEALGALLVAGQHLFRDAGLFLRADQDGGQRRALAGGAGGHDVDVGVAARLGDHADQAVEHQEVGRVVPSAETGGGLGSGGGGGDFEAVDGGDRAQQLVAGGTPEPRVADRAGHRSDRDGQGVSGVAVVGGGDRGGGRDLGGAAAVGVRAAVGVGAGDEAAYAGVDGTGQVGVHGQSGDPHRHRRVGGKGAPGRQIGDNRRRGKPSGREVLPPTMTSSSPIMTARNRPWQDVALRSSKPSAA